MQLPSSPVSAPDAETAHVYMPSFPLFRGLPAFAADSDRVSEEERCSKFHRRHNRLTPGIFTIFCGHGVCLGFKLMVNKEGPATAFDLLYTRFKTGDYVSMMLCDVYAQCSSHPRESCAQSRCGRLLKLSCDLSCLCRACNACLR